MGMCCGLGRACLGTLSVSTPLSHPACARPRSAVSGARLAGSLVLSSRSALVHHLSGKGQVGQFPVPDVGTCFTTCLSSCYFHELNSMSGGAGWTSLNSEYLHLHKGSQTSAKFESPWSTYTLLCDTQGRAMFFNYMLRLVWAIRIDPGVPPCSMSAKRWSLLLRICGQFCLGFVIF